MKLPIKILLLAIMAFSTVNCQCEVVAALASYCVGKQFTLEIQRSELEATPSWEAESENAPLSARRAIKAASVWLTRIMPDSGKWEMTEVAIQPTLVNNKWLYLVRYRAPIPPEGLKGRMEVLEVVVLMNERVVEPKIKNISSK